jgi:hypothetical protein
MQRGAFVACQRGRLDVVQLLLELHRGRLEAEDRKAVINSCLHAGSGAHGAAGLYLSNYSERNAIVNGYVPTAVLPCLVALGMSSAAAAESELLYACSIGATSAMLRALTALYESGANQTTCWGALEHGLKLACQRGHISVVCALLHNGSWSVTPRNDILYVTCEASGVPGNHLAVVHVLLALEDERKVDVSACALRAFLAACSAGNYAIAKLLLSQDGERAWQIGEQRGALLDDTFADEVCARGHHAVMRLMLDLTAPRVSARACARGFLRVCIHGSVSALRVLLEVDDDRRIPPSQCRAGLAMACRHTRESIVAELLALDDARRIKSVVRALRVVGKERVYDIHRVLARLFALRDSRMLHHGDLKQTRTTLWQRWGSISGARLCDALALQARCMRREPWIRACAVLATAKAQLLPPRTRPGASTVHAVLADPLQRMARVGGREDAPLALGSVEAGMVCRML